MKRLRADETSKDHQQHHQQHHQQQQPSNNSVAAAAAALGLAYSKPDGMQSGLYAPVAYGALGGSGAGPPPPPHQIKQAMPIAVGGHAQIRTVSGVGSPPSIPLQDITAPQQQQQSPSNNFQRLKVEDALSYLDLVKYKFGSKPQVYNDFLDIMKEFKSQSIDTPGVIQRVSNLFKGFPELIVGFNTFLPPGYKIEVQRNDQGYAFQVSVSMPSPTGTLNSGPQEHRSAMILKGSGTINMAGQNQPPPPPPQPVVQPPPPPPPVIPPAPPAAPQAPPVAQPPAPSHLPTAFGGGGGGGTPSYGSLSLSAAQAAVTHAMQGHTDTPQNQPVEFNHAINYVNKIKNRFQGQPEKYKKFLEILHTYQKEQRTLKESSTVASGMKHLTEQEVYSQVAKLFENQSDLLAEFGQFLPDATSHINQVPPLEHSNSGSAKKPLQKPYHRDALDRHHSASHKSGHVSGQVKRSPPYSSYQHRDAPPPKKHKLSSSCRDVSLSEAGKYGTLNDYAFFDKVRKAVRSQDVYNNFLRCLTLFNQEIVSKSELVQMATPFLGRAPELLRWLREFLGPGGGGGGGGGEPAEAVPLGVARAERPQGEHALEIDLATAKRLGASYCIIPKAQEGLKCSGRTQLCKEVLNDQWVSFPTWSEDSTFVSSRKTQYEEYMYRCEDERFELDVVIEVNASAIRALEGVLKKLGRMGQEDAARHKLDDCLGGTSPTQNQRAIRRIYGDKAQDIIDGLKKSPAVAVPVVLKRLKVKEEEWREAQKGFNKVWREQNEKYYLKSLDHQGINFKQTDVKALRYKSLFNEVETAFDERHEQNLASAKRGGKPVTGPHIVLPYRDRTVLDDATNLLIHHLKRQTGVQKSEKKYIKYLLKRIVPDLFHHPKQQLSDDERDASDFEDSPNSSPKSDKESKGKDDSGPGKSLSGDDRSSFDAKLDAEVKEEDQKLPAHALTSDPEEAYTLLMASNNWYIFLRLHAILCERLAKIYERAVVMATEEMKYRSNRKDSTAIVLRLKPKPQIEIEDYYPAFLDMVKNLLDGNMDATAYEDTLREMFGIYAYVAFTLDKVVSYAIRQLQYCVTERTAKSCTELFVKERKRGAAGGLCCTAHKRAHLELAYQRACEELVHEENCFKIFIYKRDCRMTIELLDIEPEDGKKVDEAKKWSEYKERFADVTLGETKPRTPVYLDRNMRLYQRRAAGGGIGRAKRAAAARNHQANRPQDEDGDKSGDDLPTSTTEDEHNNKSMNSNFDILDAIGKKLNERAGPPERRQSDRRGFDVDDDQQCKFNMQDSKIMFTVTKDSYLYNISAFHRARKSHPSVTKRKSGRFRQWLRRWGDANISDAQSKRCVDWLMGRGGDVVPNRTRVLCDNDVSRTPYAPFNRYRVERLASNGGGGGVATPAVSEVAGPAPA